MPSTFDIVLDRRTPVRWTWPKALAGVAALLLVPLLAGLGLGLEQGWLLLAAAVWGVGLAKWLKQWRRHRDWQPVSVTILPDALVVRDQTAGTTQRLPFAGIVRHRYYETTAKNGRWPVLVLELPGGRSHSLIGYYRKDPAYPQFVQMMYALEVALHASHHPSQPQPPAPLKRRWAGPW